MNRCDKEDLLLVEADNLYSRIVNSRASCSHVLYDAVKRP